MELTIGNTSIESICDTGASGGNCIDLSIFSALSPENYYIISTVPTVCVGINKVPVKIHGKVLLDFKFKHKNGPGHTLFREEFNLVENLIHPVVIGLPFLQKHKAILSFERDSIFMADREYSLGKVNGERELPPPHLALFDAVTIPPFVQNVC